MQREDGSLWIASRHDSSIEDYHVSQGSSDDCGPHAAAMAINFWHGRAIVEANALAREMNRPRLRGRFPLLVVRRIPNWATFPWGITDVLRQHGMQARWRLWASEDDLHRALRDDHIVMPVFGEPWQRRGWRWAGWSHIAILCGTDPAAETCWFVDSTHSIVPFDRPRSEFLTLWGNMGRLMVEAY